MYKVTFTNANFKKVDQVISSNFDIIKILIDQNITNCSGYILSRKIADEWVELERKLFNA